MDSSGQMGMFGTGEVLLKSIYALYISSVVNRHKNLSKIIGAAKTIKALWFRGDPLPEVRQWSFLRFLPASLMLFIVQLEMGSRAKFPLLRGRFCGYGDMDESRPTKECEKFIADRTFQESVSGD